jgi:putative ABC transport system permease protein
MTFDLDSWQEVWSTIRRNRLRTLLTALGVFWGIFMLIIMVGAGNGLERGVNRSMAGFATNSMFVWGERTSVPFKGLGPGRPVEFDNADIEVLRALPGVQHLAPRNQLGGWRGGNNVTRGIKAAAFQVNGDTPAIQHIQSVKVQRGRHLNELDLGESRKVAVAGKRVQELLFSEGEDPIGQTILIQGVPFKVVGIFDSLATGDEGERMASTIYIPFTTFQRAFHAGDEVGWFAMTIAPGFRSAEVAKAVKAVLGARHHVAPGDPEAIDSFNAEEEFEKVSNLFLGIRLLIWVVGTATLLAGVVGVSNIMLISVKERTREIGIRKALGATPRGIIGQILQESVVLTALAGYLGVIAGVGILELAGLAVDAMARSGEAPAMFSNPQIDLGVALRATIVLVVAGALAGVIPARNAARVDPVIALRTETT